VGDAEEIVACVVAAVVVAVAAVVVVVDVVVVVGGIGGPAAVDIAWVRMGATEPPRWACCRDSVLEHETGPRVECAGAFEEEEECSCWRSACGG